MSLGDQSKDGYLSFDEFLKYMSDHERKLWLVFKSIDIDDNGKHGYLPHVILPYRNCVGDTMKMVDFL
jgi:hypothetical protein